MTYLAIMNELKQIKKDDGRYAADIYTYYY